jgi:3-hydroxyacyl-[acyl-carrier-protein] dehydratase
MRFGLIDKIEELQRGQRIVAVKAVSLAEEYLADHFPTFPVLPGVFILQGLIEAASWLAYDALDFAPRVILLREAKNVTYKSFVKPGNLLRLEVACKRMSAECSDFEGVGFCGQSEMVRARFQLEHYDAGREPRIAPAVTPARMAERKTRFQMILQM